MKDISVHRLVVILLTVSVLLGGSLKGFAQFPNGNEWIVPAQEYIKVKVRTVGVQRITGTELSDFIGENPANLRVYHNGEEVPVYVSDNGTTGAFDATDFIEFYAERTDGSLDAELYRHPVTGLHDPDQQANPLRSMFTDTSAYFVTVSDVPRPAQFSFQPVSVFDYVNNVSELSTYPQVTTTRDFSYRTFVDQYNNGDGSATNPTYALNPDYVTGEGYMSQPFTSRSITVNTPFAVSNGSDARISLRTKGVSSTTNNSIEVSTGGCSQIFPYNGIVVDTYFFDCDASAVNSNGTVVNIDPAPGAGGRNRLAFVQVEYTRELRFDGENFNDFLFTNPFNADVAVQIPNLDLEPNDEVFLFDIRNRRRISGTIEGGVFYAVIPKPLQGGESEMVLITRSRMEELALNRTLESARIQNHAAADAGAEYVIITHSDFLSSAERLRTYRDTCTVNPVNGVKLVTVEELYDEFSYGSPTPLAIKRFCRTALENWNIQPKYLMLWGKGRSDLRRYGFRNVPSWGSPATDYEFVSNFNPVNSVDYVPQIAVGRLNVTSNAIGDQYVDKLNEYEHTPYAAWMKHAVHLGGGKDANEQNSIRNFMEEQQEPIYEGFPLGGSVDYFQKQTNNVIQNNTSSDVREIISNGVGLIQFFGHSTADIFEVEMLEPYNYTNFGRYPFIIANGCKTGDFASGNKPSFGERFMNEPGRGSIGYLSTSGLGFLSQLGNYTTQFYEINYRDSIGLPIGDAIALTVDEFLPVNQKARVNQARTSNLQGDPMVRLYFPTGPDLEITAGDISFAPDNFTANIDSYTVHIVCRNNGLAFADSFDVRVQQTVLSTGQTIDYGYRRYPPVFSQDTLQFVIRNPDPSLAGLNMFDVFVDARDTINETNENNNRVLIEQNIPSNLAVPLFPYEFAIVNQSQISLQAATYGVSNETYTYEYEIDTSYYFDSPFKRSSGPIQGSAVFSQWELPFQLQDSTVYYWRVRLLGVEEETWTDVSFKYIEGEYPGWAQSQPPQFFEVPADTITMNRDEERWQFDKMRKSIVARMGVTQNKFEMFINAGNDGSTEPIVNNIPGVLYTQIEGKTLLPTTFHDGYFNVENVEQPFEMGRLTDLIQTMAPGDYLLVANRGNMAMDQWPQGFWSAMQQLGASGSLQSLPPDAQFLFLGRKGAAPGTAVEILQPNDQNQDVGALYVLDADMFSKQVSGRVRTRLIGPSAQWIDLNWDWWSNDNQLGDQTRVSVFGVRSDFTEEVFLQDIDPGSFSLTGIDAEEYPYLRLMAKVEDRVNRTAPQLDNWHVHYAPVPEAMIDPGIVYNFESDTVQEGEPIRLTIGTRNITEFDMDSLLIRLEVRTANNTVNTLIERYEKPLLALDEDTLQLEFSSAGLAGGNTLVLTINPGLEQPEQHLFNNVYQKRFFVRDDNRNPILDVTFDGRHIIEGEIVAPSPEIQIQVNDENPYFLIDDPNLVEVYFKKSDDPEPIQQIPPTDDRLEFVSAQNEENKARLFFRPENLEDGMYELEVQSYDKNGNASGVARFKTTFEVVNRSTITNILNYPNPFSTSTRFVYTLTGNTLPEVFKLQIYTVSGRLVKTIDFVELGEVAVGQHITNYAWDGTDEYGDRLANGVYLYRVQLRMPGQETMELNDSQTGKYFKKGWGKMVILR